MKKSSSIFLFLFLISISNLIAQDLPGGLEHEELESEEAMAKKYDLAKSVYGHIDANGVNMNNYWALELGIGIAYMLNGSTSLGINYGYLFTHTIKLPGISGAHLNMSHFGFEAQQLLINSKKFAIPLHAYFAVANTRALAGNQIDLSGSTNTYWFFFIEPGLAFDYKYSRSTWISLGVKLSGFFGL
jgi:hypothetical protein